MDGGRTIRDRLLSRLERAERKGHQGWIATLEAQLACPPFPTALSYLWQAFLRLRGRAMPTMSGPGPITYSDLDSYTRLTRMSLAPWEVQILENLDDIYLASVSAAQAADKEQATRPETPEEQFASIGGRMVARRGKQDRKR